MDTDRYDQPQRIGAGVLLVPLLVMSLVVLYSQGQFGVPHGDRAQPPPLRAESLVPGLAGTLEAEEGLLYARLAPLHADPVRQRFDTRALGERFGRTEGAPWRLVIGLAGPTRVGAVGLQFHDIVITDDKGLALEPVLERVWPNENGALDPVAVLFAPPPGRLFPGEEISLILWGRPPEAGATVSGVGADTGMALHSERVPRVEFLQSLARLDRDRDEARDGLDLENR